MSSDALKTVRVIAGTNNPIYKQVNIVTSKTGYLPNEIPTWLQASSANTLNNYPTVQKTAATVPGFETVFISGFSAPA